MEVGDRGRENEVHGILGGPVKLLGRNIEVTVCYSVMAKHQCLLCGDNVCVQQCDEGVCA